MELEDTMASLELNDRSQDSPPESPSEEEAPGVRRSLRLRSRTQPLSVEKRRVLTKPIKIPKDSSTDSVENYYLDKRVKRLHPTLETIYEEARQLRDEDAVMSSKKFQRKINFSVPPLKNGGKVRKRKMKAKHLAAPRRAANKKITLKFLMEKLASIKDDED